ncbi:MAG TPA: low-specificity L-threonine aldolase [Spirochaetia bacterium]|nr:low-specificity L-threonine aldolase [Spirochaetia bacterium]
MKAYDLRSDTVTRPSPGMRKAMYEAEVGDDVYGEDPSVNKLQEMSAAVTGKEAALFVSSGSMGNLIPLYLNCGKGNEVLCDSRAHIVHHELASCTAIAGSLPVQVSTDRGILAVEQLEPCVQPDIYYCARTKMIAVENTHNAAGGTFYPLDTLKKIGVFARRRKMSVHMDGARLFNASTASGDAVKLLCADVDTVTFCISKGLGAPVGAVLCGTKEFIAEARRVRKLLGGGMRQAGVIAAAGIYALTNNVERLAEDHENAKTLARALACTSWAALVPEEVVTNIVYFRTPDRSADDVVHALEQRGILSGAEGPDVIRFVTHLDISKKDTAEIARILQEAKL